MNIENIIGTILILLSLAIIGSGVWPYIKKSKIYQKKGADDPKKKEGEKKASLISKIWKPVLIIAACVSLIAIAVIDYMRTPQWETVGIYRADSWNNETRGWVKFDVEPGTYDFNVAGNYRLAAKNKQSPLYHIDVTPNGKVWRNWTPPYLDQLPVRTLPVGGVILKHKNGEITSIGSRKRVTVEDRFWISLNLPQDESTSFSKNKGFLTIKVRRAS